MALGDRKSSNIFNTRTGASKDSKSIDEADKTRIEDSFNNGDHIVDLGMFENLAPALHAIQQLSEDIEELRRYITAEITSITSAQASAITANTAKRTSPSWVPSSNPNYLTSSSTQSKYLRSDSSDSWTGKLTWAGTDYADGINMSLGNINDAHYVDANEYRQRLSGRPRNNLGDPTVTEMALFEEQFGPKTTLANDYDDLSDLTFWGQETSSSDWVEITSYSDDQKRKFLRTNNSSVIIPNTYYKFRVEFTAKSYTFANAMYMYWSSNSHNTQVHIWKKRCSDGTWLQHTSETNTISSWPGHGWLPFSSIAWHETNTTSTGHYTDIRVEFTPNWSTGSSSSNNISIYGMQIWGGYPKGRRTPHYYDQNGEFNFLKSAHILDGHNLNIGSGNDLQIYHDGSNSYIKDTGTGTLNISSNQLNLNASNGENAIQINENADVKIRHNNIVKLATTSTGVEVQDVLQVTTNGTATLILRGDNNNSGDTGQLDSTIKMLHDDGTHGILMETKNFASKQRFEIKSLSSGTESSRFVIHEDNYITTSGNINGRNIATDGTKLDTIATNADVTPSWVPSSDPGYGTSNLALGTTSTTALAGDTVTITTAQAAILTNLANLPTRRGASGTFWNNRGMVAVS